MEGKEKWKGRKVENYDRKRKQGIIGEGECSVMIRDRPLTKERW